MPPSNVRFSTRPLHFIWICDCSLSMLNNGKIQSLNNAIRDVIPVLKKVADENVYADVLIRAIKFSAGAQWHIANPTPIDKFEWQDLVADGVTDMGKALEMVAEQMKMPPMTDRGLPPVLILISDGEPTDDFGSGLKQLMEQPWAKKAVRMAIAIGEDANKETLQKFIGHPELRPLEANSPENLVKCIKWASTVALQVASAPASQIAVPGGMQSPMVPIPQIPQNLLNDSNDVW